MHEQDHGKEVENRRDKGNFDDLKIGRLGEFSHQEGACPHDGRHELPPGGGRCFHGCGDVGLVSDLFHHGDGKGACGHHIGHCAPGNRSHESTGNHRRFCRSPGKSAGKRIGRVDKKIPGSRLVKKGPEQNKYKDKRCRYSGGKAEYSFRGERKRGGHTFNGISLMDKDIRHVRSEIPEKEKS